MSLKVKAQENIDTIYLAPTLSKFIISSKFSIQKLFSAQTIKDINRSNTIMTFGICYLKSVQQLNLTEFHIAQNNLIKL